MPAGWVSGGFLPDGHTLYTENSAGTAIRLWDVADPRHPQARGTVPGSSVWTADDGQLLIWDAASASVKLWDIRNPSRPALDATFGPARPVSLNGSEVLGLFPGNLAGIGNGDVLQLWNVSDPRHPVQEGAIPIGSNSAWAQPSGSLLVTGSYYAPAAIWNLASAHAPAEWVSTIDIDAGTGTWVNDHTLVGFTSDDNSLDLWNVRYPADTVATAALPLDSGYTAGPTSGIEVSQGSRLLAAGISSNRGYDEGVEVWQAAADGRSLSQYTEVSGNGGSYDLAPDGGFLATNVATNQDNNAADELNAFADQPLPNGTVGIIYPLDTDAVYAQLCSIASQAPVSSSWQEYLPETYYRPACS
jgi:WD40 repeat protein